MEQCDAQNTKRATKAVRGWRSGGYQADLGRWTGQDVTSRASEEWVGRGVCSIHARDSEEVCSCNCKLPPAFNEAVSFLERGRELEVIHLITEGSGDRMTLGK